MRGSCSPRAPARRLNSPSKADSSGDQYADWPDVVHRVMSELGYAEGDGLTKDELVERAQELTPTVAPI